MKEEIKSVEKHCPQEIADAQWNRLDVLKGKLQTAQDVLKAERERVDKIINKEIKEWENLKENPHQDVVLIAFRGINSKLKQELRKW